MLLIEQDIGKLRRGGVDDQTVGGNAPPVRPFFVATSVALGRNGDVPAYPFQLRKIKNHFFGGEPAHLQNVSVEFGDVLFDPPEVQRVRRQF